MTKDYEIRVFTTEKGKKIYAVINSEKLYCSLGLSFDEIMEAVARFKHDKIGTLYNIRKGSINRYKDGLDGLWFCPQGLDDIYCIACWKGDL